ncbi:UV-stimulated scaffold protein A-like isoform X2 [Argopecten irradians]|uniref:UV-stimulated scaffold protein A-like isoform X2 n=1 Tax=Argopecten irradians TaxID=31199 RepID=UPI003714F5CD
MNPCSDSGHHPKTFLLSQKRKYRFKCPSYGKVIRRDGNPTEPEDIARLVSKESDTTDEIPALQDPKLQADREAALGVDLDSGKSKSKGWHLRELLRLKMKLHTRKFETSLGTSSTMSSRL